MDTIVLENIKGFTLKSETLKLMRGGETLFENFRLVKIHIHMYTSFELRKRESLIADDEDKALLEELRAIEKSAETPSRKI